MSTRQTAAGAACLLGAFLPLTVPAAGAPDEYLSVGAIYTDPDANRAADYGYGFVGSYAHRLGGRTFWELRGFSHVLESEVAGSDFYHLGLGLDLMISLGPETGGHGFVLIGGGAVDNDVTPDDKDGGSGYFNAGIGWRFQPWENWGLRPRAELRAVRDSFDDGQDDLQFALILEIPPKRLLIEERVVEKVVEKEKVVEVPVEVIKEVPVAPMDADGDGIPDVIDQCPNTIQGAAVGPDGCVRQEQTVTLPNIEFESSRAVLRPAGREKLAPVVQFLKDQPDVELDVYGHTDATGSEAYNQKLSDQRAAAVRQFLVDQGVAGSRLTSKGFGESQPIASNATEEGKAANRRVELRIRTRD